MADPLSQRQIRRIARRFGLKALRSTPVSSLYRKNAVIQVRTDTGTYALKPFLRNAPFHQDTSHQMRTAAKYTRSLMNSGYSFMPPWLPAATGELWILNQGTPFYITEWIKGRRLEIPGDFEKLGRALAVLHTNPFRLPFSHRSATLEQIRLWKTKDRLFRRNMTHASNHNKRFRRSIRKYGEAWKRLSDQAWTEIKRPEIARLLKEERARPALIHGDITSPNVIIADDERLFIIDWDRIMVGSIYVDTAKALMNTTGFNSEFMQSFLRGYEEIRPLSQTERRLITALYGLPREMWYAIRFPNRSRSGEMLEIMNQTWPLRKQAMKFMGGWANP